MCFLSNQALGKCAFLLDYKSFFKGLVGLRLRLVVYPLNYVYMVKKKFDGEWGVIKKDIAKTRHFKLICSHLISPESTRSIKLEHWSEMG